jgi:S1-C subfamily serine protease
MGAHRVKHPVPGRRAGWTTVVLLLLLGTAGAALWAQSGPPPAAVPAFCPRCGYRVEPDWHYCMACGWNLRVLTGAAAAARLQKIGASVIGLILVKEPPSLDEILPPNLLKYSSSYAFAYRPGKNKFFATAFPFLKPGIFVTSARALEWVELGDMRTYNNRQGPIEILGYDLPSGIGVVKADVPDAVPLKPSASVRELDTTWAICFPVSQTGRRVEYLPESFHRGRVSSTGQQGTHLVAFENLLRTDHTIEDGCLGGLIVDPYGDAAGVILHTPDPGIVYAMPVADMTALVEVLSQRKKLDRPYFGIGLTLPDERRRARFQLPEGSTMPVVAYLVPGSPAEKAGLLPGDVLTAVGSEKVSSLAGAGARLLTASPGGPPVTLTVSRAAKELQLSIAPAHRPRRIMLSPADEMEETLQANLVEVFAGPTSQQGLRLANLVRGGRGEKRGYFDGDLITEVYGKGVRRRETFDRIVRERNSHIFADTSSEEGPARLSTYSIWMKMRDAKSGDKVDSSYLNLFPDVLTAPVY